MIMGVGMGNVMSPATESIMGSLPREKAGVGSAMNDTTRQVGGAVGVAVLGSILSSHYGADLASRALREGAGAARHRGRATPSDGRWVAVDATPGSRRRDAPRSSPPRTRASSAGCTSRRSSPRASC